MYISDVGNRVLPVGILLGFIYLYVGFLKAKHRKWQNVAMLYQYIHFIFGNLFTGSLANFNTTCICSILCPLMAPHHIHMLQCIPMVAYTPIHPCLRYFLSYLCFICLSEPNSKHGQWHSNSICTFLIWTGILSFQSICYALAKWYRWGFCELQLTNIPYIVSTYTSLAICTTWQLTC